MPKKNSLKRSPKRHVKSTSKLDLSLLLDKNELKSLRKIKKNLAKKNLDILS